MIWHFPPHPKRKQIEPEPEPEPEPNSSRSRSPITHIFFFAKNKANPNPNRPNNSRSRSASPSPGICILLFSCEENRPRSCSRSSVACILYIFFGTKINQNRQNPNPNPNPSRTVPFTFPSLILFFRDNTTRKTTKANPNRSHEPVTCIVFPRDHHIRPNRNRRESCSRCSRSCSPSPVAYYSRTRHAHYLRLPVSRRRVLHRDRDRRKLWITFIVHPLRLPARAPNLSCSLPCVSS